MSVSDSYREFIVEQLSALLPIRAKKMFGGVGLYSEDLFFAMIDDDTLYFKVDESNRADYEAAGMEPFRPYPNNPERTMSYYQVPMDVLENPTELLEWAQKALAVAERKARR